MKRLCIGQGCFYSISKPLTSYEIYDFLVSHATISKTAGYYWYMKAPWKRIPKSQDLSQLPDSELVQLAKDNQEAFGILYERYIGKIYNYIYYRTGNHHDAEDLTALVFYRAMGHIENYTERGVPFQAWLYRIAHNLVANWHRDRGRRKIVALEEFAGPAPSSEVPDVQTEDKEEREILLETIRRLPEERQQLLILKFIERMSNAEIGDIMGRTEGAIKSLYHRTLIALRDELNMHEIGHQLSSRINDTEG
jgi:RNA polymerase sigma-70 factor (ECF subfamily)